MMRYEAKWIYPDEWEAFMRDLQAAARRLADYAAHERAFGEW